MGEIREQIIDYVVRVFQCDVAVPDERERVYWPDRPEEGHRGLE